MINERIVPDIKDAMDQLHRAENTKALEYYARLEKYLSSLDFSAQRELNIDILLNLSRYLITAKEGEKAKALLSNAMQITQAHGFTEYEIKIRSNLAVIEAMSGDYYKAVEQWEKLLELPLSDANKLKILTNLSIGYTRTHQFDKAIDICYDLLKNEEQNPSPDTKVNILINLGNAYRDAKQTQKALDATMQALDTVVGLNTPVNEALVLNNIGLLYEELDETEKALEYQNRSLVLRMKYSPESHLATAYNNIGTIYRNMGNYTEAMVYFRTALQIYLKYCDVAALANCYINIGSCFAHMGDFEQALEYAKRGAEIADDLKLSTLMIDTYTLMRNCYEKIGDSPHALDYSNRLCDLLLKRNQTLSNSMISKSEAEYLRGKIQAQNESYRIKNIELESSNKLISEQSRKLKKSNKLLSESLEIQNKLISVISHDVRGPISNAVLALKMINDNEFDPQETQAILKDLVISLDETTYTLTEIMLWIDNSSHQKLCTANLIHTDLLPIISSVLQIYNSQIKQKNLTLNYQINRASVKITTDPNALKVIIRNILSNAIKFTHPEGSITIKILENDSFVELHITDTGIGMNPEQINRLYRQSLKTTLGTSKEGGFGIGLKLSLHYLKLINAELKLESTPGIGSTFCLILKK